MKKIIKAAAIATIGVTSLATIAGCNCSLGNNTNQSDKEVVEDMTLEQVKSFIENKTNSFLNFNFAFESNYRTTKVENEKYLAHAEYVGNFKLDENTETNQLNSLGYMTGKEINNKSQQKEITVYNKKGSYFFKSGDKSKIYNIKDAENQDPELDEYFHESKYVYFNQLSKIPSFDIEMFSPDDSGPLLTSTEQSLQSATFKKITKSGLTTIEVTYNPYVYSYTYKDDELISKKVTQKYVEEDLSESSEFTYLYTKNDNLEFPQIRGKFKVSENFLKSFFLDSNITHTFSKYDAVITHYRKNETKITEGSNKDGNKIVNVTANLTDNNNKAIKSIYKEGDKVIENYIINDLYYLIDGDTKLMNSTAEFKNTLYNDSFEAIKSEYQTAPGITIFNNILDQYKILNGNVYIDIKDNEFTISGTSSTINFELKYVNNKLVKHSDYYNVKTTDEDNNYEERNSIVITINDNASVNKPDGVFSQVN